MREAEGRLEPGAGHRAAVLGRGGAAGEGQREAGPGMGQPQAREKHGPHTSCPAVSAGAELGSPPTVFRDG